MTLFEMLKIKKTEDPDEKVRKALFIGADQFFRGGCYFGPEDWLYMTAVEKAVLIKAKELIRREYAIINGLASQGPASAAKMNIPLDGGEAATRVELIEISDEMVDRING